MKPLVRFASIAAALVALFAAVKAMRRPGDPLPTPAASPSEPWPPLRGDAAPIAGDPWTPDAAPASNVPDPAAEVPAVAATSNGTPPETSGSSHGTASGSSHGTAGAPWTEPAGDGSCPDGYPVKAKMGSKIFHSPGQLNYDRTTPDRCYVDAAAAEADGLRAAKR